MPLAPKLNVQSLNHPDSKKVYVFVEQVWLELESPLPDRQATFAFY